MQIKKFLAIFAIAFLLTSAPIFAASHLKGIDLFGTSQIDIQQIQTKFSNRIEKLVAFFSSENFESAGNLYQEIIEELKQR
ncbi:MAG: hypothetical protein MUD14_24085 [Hydrococcus sp. Prado102]|jgi:hypothetical protein|nr:hypothetical protein [Hydrococcus sp. Prado102]